MDYILCACGKWFMTSEEYLGHFKRARAPKWVVAQFRSQWIDDHHKVFWVVRMPEKG
jgi:hypothetical protein